MTPARLLVFLYAALFFFVAGMGYVPGWTNENGYLFGLFALDTYDNLLHAGSGLWALIAALISTRQAVIYLRLFGTVYLLDGIVGLFFGNAFLDFGIFQYGVLDNPLIVNILLNAPHIAIGGAAAIVGWFVGSRTWGELRRWVS